jgi:hypothetical protein
MLNKINIEIDITLYAIEDFKTAWYIRLGNQKFNSFKSKINDKICGTLFNKIDNLLISNIRKNYE